MNSEMCMNYRKLKLIKESLGKTDFELKDLEEWFDDNISPHDASVLRRLYGLDGDTPMSYEEVAGEFNTTEGRVREFESRSLQRILCAIRRNK